MKCLTSEDSDKLFFVTLNNSGAQKLIFGTNIWPKGVVTRPFKPAPKQKATKPFKLRAANNGGRGQSQSKKSGQMKQRNLQNQCKPDYHQQYQYGSPWHHHDGRASYWPEYDYGQRWDCDMYGMHDDSFTQNYSQYRYNYNV